MSGGSQKTTSTWGFLELNLGPQIYATNGFTCGAISLNIFLKIYLFIIIFNYVCVWYVQVSIEDRGLESRQSWSERQL